MENPDIVNTNEQCDSPVYVETSPVSSPVFVSKEREIDSESSTQVTDKLTDKLILKNNDFWNGENKPIDFIENIMQ